MKADTAVQCYQLLSSGAIIVYYFNSTQLGTTTRVLLQYIGCYMSAIFKHVVTTVLYYFSTSGTTSWSNSILGTTSDVILIFLVLQMGVILIFWVLQMCVILIFLVLQMGVI